MSFGKLEIVRGSGDALDLSDLAHYAVTDYDGFGAAPMHLITERGPLQHGASYRGYRLDERVMQIGLALRAASWDDMYLQRGELLEWLSPVADAPLILRFTLPDDTVRQIDCYCTDGPTYGRKDALGHLIQKAVIQLTAVDPAWYDPERQAVQAVSGPSGGDGWDFPLTGKWTFGGQTVDVESAVDYAGTWIEYPEILINGPISDPKITHVETGETLDFDGTVLAEGESLTIDLRYGYKTVVDQDGANQVGALTADSDLASWHLQPGDNTVRFEGTGAGAATLIAMRYYNRYLGV